MEIEGKALLKSNIVKKQNKSEALFKDSNTTDN